MIDNGISNIPSAPDEQVFHAIFEKHDAIMLLIEPETGIIVDANLAALKFYGYPKSTLCGMVINEINTLPPDQVAEERQKAFREERNYFVFPHRLANGEERIVEVHSSPIALKQKQVLFSIIHDITERKRADQALRESEEKFRHIVEYATDGVVLTDENGLVLEWNSGQTQILGLTRADVIGQPLWEIQFQRLSPERQTPEVHERIKVLFQNMLRYGNTPNLTHEQEAAVRHLDGTEHIIRSAIFSIKTSRGFQLAGISRDITERRQVEGLLEKTRKNYETFFNSIDDFLFVLDGKGNILHTNLTVMDRLGYSKEELLGESVLMVHPPERREEAGRIVAEMLAGRVEFCPVPLMTKSGRQIQVETRVTPGFWDDKSVIFGVAKDISQIRLSEEKFSKAFHSNSALMSLSLFEDGTFIDVNDVFLKTLGFLRDEVIGKTSKDLQIFIGEDQWKYIIEEIRQNRTVKDIEVVLQTKDGLRKHCLFSADVIYVGKDLCLLTVMVDITERKRAEASIATLALRNQTLLHTANDGIHVIDDLGNIVEVNTAFCNMLGYTREELLKLKVTDWDVKWPGRDLLAKISDLFKQPQVFETRHRRKDGTFLDVEINSAGVTLDGRNYLYAAARDITERKRNETIKQEALDRLQKIASRVPGVVYQYRLRPDGSSSFPFASEAIKEIYQVTPEEVREDASRVFTRIYPEDIAGVLESIQKSAADLSPWQHEYRVILDDGMVRSLYGNAVPQREEDGAILWHGFITDISERKQMEQDLQVQRDFATQVLNTMGQGLIVTNKDGRFEFVNPAYAQLFGYKPSELLGKYPSDLTAPEDHALLHEQRELRQNGETSTYESRLIRADGSIAHALVTGVPRTYEGLYVGSIEVVTDLTERKRVEDILHWNQSLLQLMSNSSPLGFFVVDNRTDNILYFNQRFCEIWEIQHLADRMKRGELKNNDIIPDCQRLVEDTVAFAESCMPLQNEENRIVIEDEIAFKKNRTIRRYSTQIRGGNDEYYGRFYIFEDISDRKQMEEALRESERFSHATVDAIPSEIAILDETGVIVAVNRKWRELAQANLTSPSTTCEGVNYLSVCDSTHGSDAVYAREIAGGIRAVINGEKNNCSFEYPCDPHGENRWFTAQITRFAGDGPIRVVVAHENITARKLAEEKLQQQNEYLLALHQISLELLGRRNMSELLQMIVDYATNFLDAPFSELMLEEDGELVVQTFTRNQDFLAGDRTGRGEAKLSWQAFDTKQPAVLEDYSTYPHRRELYSRNALHAVADFPILVRDKSIGVLALGRSQAGYIFNDIQIKNGMLFAQLAALVLDSAQLFFAAEHEISERKQAEIGLRQTKEALEAAHSELKYFFVREQQLARTDSLTGINNRRFLFELAEREFNVAQRYQLPFSMMLFDIDHFKQINDVFGHAVGDEALRKITRVVLAEIRSVDLIGRYGGDEFIILLPQTSSQEAVPLAERVHASVASIRMDTNKGPLTFTISIGIAQMDQTRAHEPGKTPPDVVENLFLRADQALYAAKQSGRNRTVVFGSG